MDVRNIALLGHGGSGKTSLVESMLYITGAIDRMGKPADGNTVCDYDPEEIKRQISISLAMTPVAYRNTKINVMDTPGNFDFAGEMQSAIRAAEVGVLVCASKDGVSVGAERCWKYMKSQNKPCMVYISKEDEENADYTGTLEALREKLSKSIAPVVAPLKDGDKTVGIVDLIHKKAYKMGTGKGAKREEIAIPADSEEPAGTILEQSIEASTEAKAGDTIRFWVSTGVPKITVTESYELPQDGREFVKIDVFVGSSTTPQYSKQVSCDLDGGVVNVPLTAAGMQRVQVYFDDVLFAEYELQFS